MILLESSDFNTPEQERRFREISTWLNESYVDSKLTESDVAKIILNSGIDMMHEMLQFARRNPKIAGKVMSQLRKKR